tara:strand:+ start:24549 stop:29525 length:4977 start_codon:yes stop_codon:yes gene_type:complete
VANNLTLSVTLTGDNRQLSGTLKDAQGDVREFSTTTERESKKAETALEKPGRQAATVSDHLRDTQREARTFGTETDRSSRQASRALAQTGDQAQTVTGHLDQMQGVAVAVGVAMATIGVREFVADTYAAVSSSQQLQASLKTVTGSIENASTAWDTLLGFAAETPFTLDQSVQAFIRMQSLGLNPSLEALRSYGNTASAMGKDMMQMVEAVADATTGEFERLKEFGIRASNEGEQISFTFQGVTTTVANSATAISQYLQQIGENQFAGAMGDQMDTLSGKASNLEDTIYQFYLAIGDAGATDVFESTLANASNTVQFLTDNIDTLASGAEVMAVLIGGRVVVALANATAAKLAATQQTIAYQLALARMAGVSGTAAAAQTALAGASRAAAGALTLVGGPVGAAMLAGGAIFYFREELGLVAPKVQSATDRVDDMTSALDANSEAALKNARAMLEAEQQFQQFRQTTLAMDVSRQRQIVADEQKQWDAVGGQQAFGMGQRSESQQALHDLQVELTNTSNAINAAGGSVTEIDEKLAQLERTTRETITPTTDLGDASTTTAAATREAAAAANELTKSTEAQASAIEDLRNRLIPGRREVVQLARDMQTLTLAMAMGTGNVAENIQLMGLLQQQYIEAQNDTDDLATKTVDAAFTMEGAFDELRLNGLRRLDDGFADLWQGAIDGSLNAGDIMKRALDQTLAEMAHMAITRPITVQMQGMMGMGGGGGQQAGGGFDLGSVGSLKNGWSALKGGVSNIAWTGAGSSYSGTGWANAATQGTGATGFMGGSTANFGGMTGLASAGAGMAGGYVGTELGSAVFGKEANSSWGATGGALVGTYFGGPLGAALGGAIGGAIDSLFGSGRKSYGQIGSQIGGDKNAGDGVYRYDRHDRSQGYAQESAFGTIGVTKKQKTDDDALISMVAAFAEIDNTLASVMTGAQLDNTREALDGWESSRTKNIGGIVDERLSAVLKATDSAFEDALSQFEGDALVQGLVSGLQIENAGAEMAAAVAADMNDEFRSALGSGSDIQAATQSILSAAQAVTVLGAGTERLGLQFDATASGALEAAGNLSAMVGGASNLSSLTSQYYDAFFTEEQKLQNLTEDLTSTFGALGLELPNSQRGVQELVSGIEVMDEAGQRQLATIYQNVPALREYVTAMEEQRAAAVESGEEIDDSAESMRAQADIARERAGLERELLQLQGNTEELRRRELTGIDVSNRALQERIWAIEDERYAAEQASQVQKQLMSGVQTAYQAVEQAVNAERQILENAYRATTDSIGRNMQTVQDAIQETESIAQSLSRALRDTQSGTAFSREQGQASLRAMLAAGEVTNQRELDNALSAVAEPSQHLFGSFLDYQRDFVGTAHDIYNLSQLTDEQLTNEEKSLRALERQMESAEIQHSREMAQLDQLLVDQAAIIEAEFGTQEWLSQVNQSVLSVETAIGALQGSIAAAGAASSAGGGGSGSSGSSNSGLTNEQIKQFADNAVAESGGDWDAAGIAIGQAAVAAGVTSKQLAEALGKNQQDVIDRAKELGVSGFDGSHADGLDRVPFDEYRAVLHKGETVLNEQAANAWRQQQLMPAPAALPMPNMPPMPFINQQSNGSNDMAVLVRRIEALTEHAKTQGGMQREALKALKALVRQLERWDDQDRVRVAVEKTVEPTA